MGCCCGPLQDEACGWPKGTVRAALALLIVLGAFIIAGGMIVMLIIYGQITVAVGVLGTIFTVVGSVSAYYFSSQQAAAATKLATDTAQRIADSKDQEIARLNDTHERILQSRGLAMPPRGRFIRKSKHKNTSNDIFERDDNTKPDPIVIVE
jgi:hypothetical protein